MQAPCGPRTSRGRPESEATAQRGRLPSRSRCHQLVHSAPSDAPRVESVRGGLIVDHGPTVAIDLSAPADERWSNFRSNHQRDITRARREGYAVQIDEGLDAIAEFADLYRGTMSRIGSSDFYLFRDEYFEELKRSLSCDLVLASARVDGELIGAALCTVSRASGLVGYHLTGSAPLEGKVQPTKLLIDHVQAWAAESGYRALHLGGGLGASEDSLFRFKHGFSAWTHRYRSVRFVLNPVRYKLLGGCRRGSLGILSSVSIA